MNTLVTLLLSIFVIGVLSGPPGPLPIPLPLLDICEFTNSQYFIGKTFLNHSEAGNGEGCEEPLGSTASLADRDASLFDLLAFLSVRRGMGKCKSFELWANHPNGTLGVLTPGGFRLNSDQEKRLLVLCKKTPAI